MCHPVEWLTCRASIHSQKGGCRSLCSGRVIYIQPGRIFVSASRVAYIQGPLFEEGGGGASAYIRGDLYSARAEICVCQLRGLYLEVLYSGKGGGGLQVRKRYIFGGTYIYPRRNVCVY